MRYFKDIERIRTAKEDELAAVDGMNKKAAAAVRDYFKKKELTDEKA